MKARSTKGRMAYVLKITVMYALAAVMLAVGSAVVSVNCHNIVSSSEMVLFDAQLDDNELIITIMGREYRLSV